MKPNTLFSRIPFVLLVAGIIIACQSTQTTRRQYNTEKKQDALYDEAAAGDFYGVLDLLEKGESPDYADKFGETALGIAAANGFADISAILLLAGADAGKADLYAETPLHKAISGGHTETAALLLSVGADQDAEDLLGRSPTDLGANPSQATIQSMTEIYGKLENLYKKSGNLEQAAHFYAWASLPEVERNQGESWMDYTERSTGEKLSQWLTLSDRDFPDEIPLPPTPEPISLVQDQLETNTEFEQRVQKADAQRRAEIANLQKQYTMEVQSRNRKVLALTEMQALRQTKLPGYRRNFAIFAMDEIFADASFSYSDAEFDQDSGDLFFNNVGNSADTLGNYVVNKAARDLREAAFYNPEKISLQVKPYATEQGQFGIESVRMSFGGQTLDAMPTADSAVTQAPRTVTIATDVTQALPQQQALRFVDQGAIGTLKYKDGSLGLTGVDDDLDLKITRLDAVKTDSRKWAVIIGAEKYKSDTSDIDNIAYARHSAELFALTAQKVLGVPEQNTIRLYDEDATSGRIKSSLKKLLNEGLRKGDILYFYYNGHGVPNPQAGNTPYILPTDMDLDYIGEEPFFALKNLYTLMDNSPAKNVIVFLDSCFTGKTDGRSVYKGKAAPRLAPEKINIARGGKLAVIAAGTETQFSSAWPQKGHRLFTWHLLNTLANNTPTVAALYESVAEDVYNTSREIGGKLSFQNPTLQGNPDITLR